MALPGQAETIWNGKLRGGSRQRSKVTLPISRIGARRPGCGRNCNKGFGLGVCETAAIGGRTFVATQLKFGATLAYENLHG